MSRSRIIRLDRLESGAKITPNAAPSPFPAIAAFVDDHGGRLPHESYADAWARLLGMSKSELLHILHNPTTTATH